MILSRVKRLLQSVEEASPLQIAADLGVDGALAAATLEHLEAMGKVVRRHPVAERGLSGGAGCVPEEGVAGSNACRERIGCASCPLVRVCDPKADTPPPTARGATLPEEELLYAWAKN